MKEHPLILPPEMAQAAFEGSKNEHRVPIKNQPPEGWDGISNRFALATHSPFKIGDRLWVKERWRIGSWDEDNGSIAIDYSNYQRREWVTVPMRADFQNLWIQSTDDARKVYGKRETYKWDPGESPCRWRSSFCMERWASRTLLEVTSVRVEKVQEIGTTGIIADGVCNKSSNPSMGVRHDNMQRMEFELYWNSHYAKRGFGWDANPWVWVYAIKRVEG